MVEYKHKTYQKIALCHITPRNAGCLAIKRNQPKFKYGSVKKIDSSLEELTTANPLLA